MEWITEWVLDKNALIAQLSQLQLEQAAKKDAVAWNYDFRWSVAALTGAKQLCGE